MFINIPAIFARFAGSISRIRPSWVLLTLNISASFPGNGDVIISNNTQFLSIRYNPVFCSKVFLGICKNERYKKQIHETCIHAPMIFDDAKTTHKKGYFYKNFFDPPRKEEKKIPTYTYGKKTCFFRPCFFPAGEKKNLGT